MTDQSRCGSRHDSPYKTYPDTTHPEIDDHEQPGFTDESINVGCVLSWRLISSANRETDVYVELHNGFVCTAPSDWDQTKPLLEELRRVEGGRFAHENVLAGRDQARSEYSLLYRQEPDLR